MLVTLKDIGMGTGYICLGSPFLLGLAVRCRSPGENVPGPISSVLESRGPYQWLPHELLTIRLAVYDAHELEENPAAAFVYALPEMSDPPASVIEWARGHVPEWMQLFRVHFKPSAGGADKPIRRKVGAAAEEGHEAFGAESDPLYWRRLQPWSRDAVQWCLFQIPSITKAEGLAALLPPIIQLAEDHEVDARLVGTRCLRRLVELAPALVVRMGLGDLILQILKVSLAFNDHPGLLSETVESLKALLDSACTDPPLPGWRAKRFSPEYFAILDELFSIVLKDLSLCKVESEMFPVLLTACTQMIVLQQLGAVRYLPVLMPAMLETSQSAPSEEARCLYLEVLKTCRPRIQRYQALCTEIEHNLGMSAGR